MAGVIALTANGDGGGPETAETTRATTQEEPAEATSSTEPDDADADQAFAAASDPSGPDDLAEAIVAAETAIRDPATSDDALPAWGRAQQRAYRQLARHPEWDAAVAAGVGPGLAPVTAANAGAFRDLWELTDPRPALPDWVIVDPPPAGELLAHYRAAEGEFGVPWEYLAAIHLVETRMGRIRGVSTAGASGPMQFLPSTWETYGEGDIEDAGDSIRAAARYLVAAGAPADMPGALFAYNHSDRYVDAVEAHAGVMRANERSYFGYYHWDVYYRLTTGDVVLPVGWTLADGLPS